jgi:hypothetical protein
MDFNMTAADQRPGSIVVAGPDMRDEEYSVPRCVPS